MKADQYTTTWEKRAQPLNLRPGTFIKFHGRYEFNTKRPLPGVLLGDPFTNYCQESNQNHQYNLGFQKFLLTVIAIYLAPVSNSYLNFNLDQHSN